MYFSQKTVFLEFLRLEKEFQFNSFTVGLRILFQKIYQKINFDVRVPLKALRTLPKIDDIFRVLAGVDDDFDVPDWGWCP